MSEQGTDLYADGWFETRETEIEKRMRMICKYTQLPINVLPSVFRTAKPHDFANPMRNGNRPK